ncbi:SecD/SecF family protein translocase subunit [Ruminococcus sp. HUN007]|uniref:preprotein translocase subunit SecD n=1 Tax=Ruminococcus sp. HUN007 TaxID=1514668 RepID=UPI0005D22DE8|nr:SecD/SecF family protein translocase subunit [Ruminococcus sp. HUN007]
MKNIKKPVFFIVFLLIIGFSYTAIFGFKYQYGDIAKTYIKDVSGIRLGIDIQGGVDVTFTPADGYDATEEQLDSVKEVMKVRLASLGISDSNVYVDNSNDRIIVRFPWQSSETDFDPEAAVKELGGTAMLTFREGTDSTTDENGETVPSGTLILNGDDVESATAMYQKKEDGNYEYVVSLKLGSEGAKKFSDATGRLYQDKGQISIWMDNSLISAPAVQAHITTGEAIISGSFETFEDAKALADKINSGALPFSLTTSSFSTISPTLGSGALKAMILGGLIAFGFIALYMIILYRLPGFVAVIGLIGQVTFTLAAISGYFSFMNSSTLTIPGIAGIILSIGMGVDANIITAERIKEELRSGKRLNTALESGYKRAFSAIFDGNLTLILIAIILMGAFGVPDSLFAKMLSFIFRWFGTTTEGTIYSFGFTLTVGAILNFVMGVWASRLMLGSLSKFSIFKNRKLYGGPEK